MNVEEITDVVPAIVQYKNYLQFLLAYVHGGVLIRALCHFTSEVEGICQYF